MTKKYDHLLFDLDNTLLNFTEASIISLRSFTDLIGIPYDESFLEVYHGINHGVWTEFENGMISSSILRKKRFELTAEHYGRQVDGLMVNRMYIRGIIKQVIYMEGALELLERLHPNNNISLITNGLKEAQRPRLNEAKMTHYFDHIIVSDEIGLAKPDEKYFDYSWQKIGRPEKSRVLVIGDNPKSDIEGARNFGFDACLYDPKNKYQKSESTFKIDHLDQIPELIY